jgi:hypothetical protein
MMLNLHEGSKKLTVGDSRKVSTVFTLGVRSA